MCYLADGQVDAAAAATMTSIRRQWPSRRGVVSRRRRRRSNLIAVDRLFCLRLVFVFAVV